MLCTLLSCSALLRSKSNKSQHSEFRDTVAEAIRPVTLPGLSRWNGSMKEVGGIFNVRVVMPV